MPKITELLLVNEERKTTMNQLERIARFHLEFEGIHPFIDGNGGKMTELISEYVDKRLDEYLKVLN